MPNTIDDFLTPLESKTKYLFDVVTESAQIDSSRLPAELLKAINMYETKYSRFYKALSQGFREESTEHTALLNEIDQICELMLQVGIKFGDLNFDVNPEEEESVDNEESH
ncbi:MAG: hypothetical protein GX096_12155 [Clostridiales bacterium]|nr:hypothetical protein [Clostridiales bacterium]